MSSLYIPFRWFFFFEKIYSIDRVWEVLVHIILNLVKSKVYVVMWEELQVEVMLGVWWLMVLYSANACSRVLLYICRLLYCSFVLFFNYIFLFLVGLFFFVLYYTHFHFDIFWSWTELYFMWLCQHQGVILSLVLLKPSILLLWWWCCCCYNMY